MPRNAKGASLSNDPEVWELLLCATNEGTFYDRFRAAAIQATDESISISAPFAGASAMLRHASAYVRFYAAKVAGNLDWRLTAPQLCLLAAELLAYYVDHLAEYDPADLRALRSQLARKGLL